MKKLTVVFVVLFLHCACVYANSVKEKCQNSDDEFLCIIKERNADETKFFNGENWEYLFQVFNKEDKKARDCIDIDATVRYARNLAAFETMSAELHEGINESLEELCMKNQDCFNSAMESLDNNARAIIESRFLSSPTIYVEGGILNCYHKKSAK
jgi:hypothetical protein